MCTIRTNRQEKVYSPVWYLCLASRHRLNMELVGSVPACYGSSLGHIQTSLKKYKNCNISQGAASTLQSTKNIYRKKKKYVVRSPTFIWAPVYICTHWLRPRNSPPPPTFGLIYGGAIGHPKWSEEVSLSDLTKIIRHGNPLPDPVNAPPLLLSKTKKLKIITVNKIWVQETLPYLPIYFI